MRPEKVSAKGRLLYDGRFLKGTRRLRGREMPDCCEERPPDGSPHTVRFLPNATTSYSLNSRHFCPRLLRLPTIPRIACTGRESISASDIARITMEDSRCHSSGLNRAAERSGDPSQSPSVRHPVRSAREVYSSQQLALG